MYMLVSGWNFMMKHLAAINLNEMLKRCFLDVELQMKEQNLLGNILGKWGGI